MNLQCEGGSRVLYAGCRMISVAWFDEPSVNALTWK